MTHCEICKHRARSMHMVSIEIHVADRKSLLSQFDYFPAQTVLRDGIEVCDRCVAIAHVTAACFDRIRREFAGQAPSLRPTALDAIRSRLYAARDRLVRWAGGGRLW